jgi:LCP family protein required for cell wall assembly
MTRDPEWQVRPRRVRAGWPVLAGLRARASTGYLVTCAAAALTLLASGLSYVAIGDVAAIGSSHAIASGPSTGPQNILLMGLESRTYWNGTILPPQILGKLHAGSAAAVADGTGGNDTNTLILIHLFAGGTRAVGFSIPRDDWVSFAGTIRPQQSGKIDQAYGVSMFYREQQLAGQDPRMSRDQMAFEGNEAGQAAAVATVEKLTGVHIDHFAAVNMYGFYELARVLGGVEVCLRHAVNDPYSGARFRAGLQHLDAAQALAFVRQRHGLPNGDLDRTHRQQAFLDSVMHQLDHQGVLNDLTQMQALLSVARQYVITDAGWNLLDFAAQARSLTSARLVFRTLPIEGYATIAGQDANLVNVADIQAMVHAAFYRAPGPRHSRRLARTRRTTVDVLNGGHTTGLAHRVSALLIRDGYRAGTIGNTSPRAGTAVLFGAGQAAQARAIATLFGATTAASASMPRGQVEVLLGASAVFPGGSAAGMPRPSAAAVIPSTGPQGGAVSARDGIPCVN